MCASRVNLPRALSRLPNHGGTYGLVLACQRAQVVRVGRLGHLQLRPGFYVYVGSAQGPGGLRARLRHHLAPVRRPHWHCDYLRPVCVPVAVWFSAGSRHVEHTWAQCLARSGQSTVPLPGFGASDCSCVAHLFFVRTWAALRRLRRCLALASPTQLCSLTWADASELHPAPRPGRCQIS